MINEKCALHPPVAASFEITSNFMAVCGVETLQKLQYIVLPNKLENMAFADIEKMILAYMKPKQPLIIAERTRFYNISQEPLESVMVFVARLRKELQHCAFENLKACADPTEEMIRMALIAGLRDTTAKEKVLEKLQNNAELTVQSTQEFVQQYEELKNCVGQARSLDDG